MVQQLGMWRLAIVGLLLSSMAGAQTGSIGGVVRDSLGAVIAGAHVAVAGSAAQATSDSRGAFLLTGVRGGSTRLLLLRRLGFAPETVAVEVPSGARIDVAFTMRAIARSLQPVEVQAQREAADSRLAGFNRRVGQRVGHFFTREDIDRKAARRITDLLRALPGLKIASQGTGPKSIRLRGHTCAPLVFVDGFPASAGSFDVDIVDMASVEGIEVYNSGSSVPPEFLGPRGMEQCGVIAIWSRPSRDRQSANDRLADQQQRSSKDTAEVQDVVQSLVSRGLVMTAEQVDVRAAYVAGSAVPVYPDSLFLAGRQGRVVFEFVVDTLGRVEEGTVGLVSTTSAALADAASQVIASARFMPATVGKLRVRQAARLAFEFTPPPR